MAIYEATVEVRLGEYVSLFCDSGDGNEDFLEVVASLAEEYGADSVVSVNRVALNQGAYQMMLEKAEQESAEYKARIAENEAKIAEHEAEQARFDAYYEAWMAENDTHKAREAWRAKKAEYEARKAEAEPEDEELLTLQDLIAMKTRS